MLVLEHFKGYVKELSSPASDAFKIMHYGAMATPFAKERVFLDIFWEK